MNVLAITNDTVLVFSEGEVKEVSLIDIHEFHELVCDQQSFRLGASVAHLQTMQEDGPKKQHENSN